MATPQVKDRLADYVPVNERLEQFWGDHPNGKVLTTIVEHSAENGFILMRAEVYRTQEDVVPAASGHAFENRSEGYVNRTSYLENCETSAVGRALALMGYEIKRGIASRQEMEKVERMSQEPEKRVLQAVKPAVEREVLINSVRDAFKLLNQAGDVPPWTPKLMNEFAVKNFGLKVDDLELEPLRDLIKKLSLRLDDVKKGSGPSVGKQQEGPYCDCGVARARKEGVKNGKKWAGFMCINSVKEHKPVWIDLDAEAETEAIAHQDDADDMNWLETD